MIAILVIARCLNEERFIERFLGGYDWAQGILLADGGSTDRTLEIARCHPKVIIRHFDSQVALANGMTMNPENAHAQFLFNEAYRLRPDWIIYDDMDCVPNRRLRERARRIIVRSPHPEIHAYRLYLWMQTQYLPKMMAGQSLWAWKPSAVTISTALEKDPFDMEYRHSQNWQSPRLNLKLPLCLLHDGWTDEARLQEKMARYAAWGRPQTHPLDFYGPAEPLPEYAHE